MERHERFSDLPPAVQAQLAIFTPLMLGLIAGLVVVHGSTVYWIIQVIAFLGGIAAGTEHDGPREGAIRGVIGGLVYGLGIYIAFKATGEDAKISSEPTLLLPVITAILGAGLGALGGIIGARSRAGTQRPATRG